MQRAAGIADHRVDIAPDDHRLIAREREELGRVLDQAGLARGQSDWRGERQAEASHGGPEEQRDGDEPLRGREHERPFEQYLERRGRMIRETMHGFIKYDVASARAQSIDQRCVKRSVFRESMILQYVGIGEDP